MSGLVVTQLRGCITPCLRVGLQMVLATGNVWALARIGLALPALRRPSGYEPLANEYQTLIIQGIERGLTRLAKQLRGFRPQI